MRIHAVLSVPFGASSGWAWGLSIVFLVMFMRLLMVPLFVKQVNAQRKMQSHMPQLQEIRKKYKNDKQRLNEETMKFYKENGINPLGGCLPLIAQLPVFFALFSVLRAIADWQPGQVPKYGLTVPVVESAREARIFGASLADKFLFPLPHQTLSSRIVILIFVLVIYWVTTNVWTLGQQHFLFRNLPVVGSDTVGASAAQATSASSSGKAGAAGKTGAAGKSGAAGKAGTAGKTGTSSRSGAAKSGASGRPAASAKPAAQNAGANGAAVDGSARGL